MRLVSFGEPGRERPGVIEGGEILDLTVLRPQWPTTWRGILGAGLLSEVPGLLAAGGSVAAARVPLGSVRLGPPIPDPSKIVAVGLNYGAHAAEQKKEPPEVPLLFAKAPSCLVGPNDPIVLPEASVEDRVDAEAELAVVVGRRARRISPEEALDHVLGFTVFNDVSGRGAQYGDRQWFRGKSFDTFGPCGPWIVTRDELPDPRGLALEAYWGEVCMQSGNTDDLIHGIPELLAYISRQMTLEPGDLIATGTPAGVGVFRDPPQFLRRGTSVRIRLERVGELLNPVI